MTIVKVCKHQYEPTTTHIWHNKRGVYFAGVPCNKCGFWHIKSNGTNT